MPDSDLLWFFSTDRGRGYHIEGQRFDLDDDGCVAVPENIGLIISRHPELKYIGRAIGLVPLGTVHSDTYCELLMQRVEADWREARLLLWGDHRDERRQCKPIPHPYSLELLLDWAAGPGREDAGNPRFPELKYFCDVSAYHRHNPSDSWTELLIAKADLDRLRNMIAAEHAGQMGTRSRNAIPPTLPSTPRVAIDGSRPTEPTQAGKVPRAVVLQKPRDSTDRDVRAQGGVSQRRGTYIGELKAFMTRLKPQSLNSLDDDDVVRRFEDYVEARIKRGQSVLKLPQRRHIANQVAKIRAQIAEGIAPERQ
jgi:hypothetical protein